MLDCLLTGWCHDFSGMAAKQSHKLYGAGSAASTEDLADRQQPSSGGSIGRPTITSTTTVKLRYLTAAAALATASAVQEVLCLVRAT